MEDTELFKVVSDLPFIHRGVLYDAPSLSQNKTCLKCRSKDCLDKLSTDAYSNEYLCKKKFNCVSVTFKGKTFIINGLIFPDNNEIPSGRLNSRREYVSDKKKVNNITAKLNTIDHYTSQQIVSNIEKNFGVFHDIKTSLGLVQSCAETYISKLSGSDFNDKLNKADDSISDLFQALSFVNSQLGMIDVVVNVGSISHGTKRKINIYKLFHKLNKLFTYKAAKRNINIQWHDDGHVPDTMAFQSLEFIPITLLDNAVKYAQSDSTIKINFNTDADEIVVIVTSYGNKIAAEEQDKIFEKYFRGTNAVTTNTSGIGMGLWLAKQILLIHDGSIMYYPSNNDLETIGYNNFRFTLKR